MTKTHRRLMLSQCLAFVTLPFCVTRAQAQMTVFDPANYVQTVLTATRVLQQINNQITSLQNEAQSLINQARNLATLPTTILAPLQQAMAQTRSLINRAQSIAFDVGQIDQAFQSLYGRISLTATDQSLVNDAQSRWTHTVAGLQDAMRMQASITGNSQSYAAQVSTLLSASQTATGSLSAAQAGNQLLAVQAQQLNDLTTLIASQARAEDLRAAEVATAAAQAQEQRRRFLQSRTGYQPGQAQMFYGH